MIDFKAKPLALAALVVDRVMSEVAASNGFPKMCQFGYPATRLKSEYGHPDCVGLRLGPISGA